MSQSVKAQNYYEILEIPTDALPNQIHKAYVKAKETYSNDNPALYSVFTKEEAQDLLKLIDEAYQVLSNTESRKRYNHMIDNASTGSVAPSQPPQSSGYAAHKPKNYTPEGHAKTQLSVYKINPQFEDIIINNDTFDGEFLRRVREYKNIDLSHLSEHTRIGKNYLNAIESNGFEALPAPVFVQGFLKQLAKIYSLDENKVVSSYMQPFKESRENN